MPKHKGLKNREPYYHHHRPVPLLRNHCHFGSWHKTPSFPSNVSVIDRNHGHGDVREAVAVCVRKSRIEIAMAFGHSSPFSRPNRTTTKALTSGADRLGAPAPAPAPAWPIVSSAHVAHIRKHFVICYSKPIQNSSYKRWNCRWRRVFEATD